MSETTLSEPFRESGFWFKVGDYQFRLECLCGVQQELDACSRRVSGDFTLYACTHCGADIVGVGPDDREVAPISQRHVRPPDDDGHRMSGYVFGAKVDMELWPPAAAEPYLTIPRRTAFFEARGLT